jgi:phosphatidylglycerophosphate synthase
MISRAVINLITWSRILVSCLIFVLPNPLFILIAAIWCGISDFLDGYLARREKLVSVFGAKLDQFADKFASFAFLFCFYLSDFIDFYFLLFFVIREVLVVLFRLMNLADEESNFLGKSKTFFTYLFLVFGSWCMYYNLSFDLVRVFFYVLILGLGAVSLLFSVKKIKHQVVWFFGTGFLSSFILKKMPGTSTSLVVFAVLFFCSSFLTYGILISVFTLFVLIHYTFFDLFSARTDQGDVDPPQYTVDETLAIFLLFISFRFFQLEHVVVLGFVFFRFYDILKPLGIQRIEQSNFLSAASQNLFDDLAAAVYTLMSVGLLSFLVDKYV